MPRPTELQVTANVSARLTPGEHKALGQLLTLRATELEAAGQPPDDSFVGWLRWTIRQQAKAAGIQVESAQPRSLARTTVTPGPGARGERRGIARGK